MPRAITAVVFEAPDRIAVRALELAPCGPTEIEVETLYTYVSPGTELRVLGGHYGARDKFPLVPGYSVVGRVVAVGAEARGYRVGDLITGRNPKALPGITSYWGGQASGHIYATTTEDRPVLLPAGAEPRDYVIAEVASISRRGVSAAAPRAGETAIVIGQGLIGAFSAAWLQLAGCRVIVADVDAERLRLAAARGVAATVDLSAPDAVARLGVLTTGGADIVVESSGTTPGVKAACQLIRKKPQAYGKDYKVEPIAFYHQDWPRLVMQANYLDEVPLNPHSFFPGEGVTILTPGDRGVEDRQQTVEAIRTKALLPGPFAGTPVPAADAPAAYAALKERRVLSVTFAWPAGGAKG